MQSGNEDVDYSIGFLTLCETSGQEGYLGAILITDLHGVPQEFRCSHPVKPTAVQKPLYGDTLKPYIGVDLCGIPLIESIKTKPTLIFICKEFLLEVRPSSPCPVIFIRRAGEAIEVTVSDSPEESMSRERVDSSTGSFQPVILSSHPRFESDMPIAKNAIEMISNYFDPVEPFERIEKAITLLQKQDSRFQ